MISTNFAIYPHEISTIPGPENFTHVDNFFLSFSEEKDASKDSCISIARERGKSYHHLQKSTRSETMTSIEGVRKLAEEWASNDPNPLTSKYVRNLLNNEKASEEELMELFGKGRIGFGTAGLRAKMFPGPRYMNDLVVVQASQGLASYCLSAFSAESSEDQKKSMCAFVGYDHRKNDEFNLSSFKFACITKMAFEHAGISCVLLDGFVPTPLLAFAVKHAKELFPEKVCVAGVMVTASHNPKHDNGYKVYTGKGCQISVSAEAISQCILRSENQSPWIDYSKFEQHNLTNARETEQLSSLYFRLMSKELSSNIASSLHDESFKTLWRKPRVAYTAMHGVGAPWARKALKCFSLKEGEFYDIVLSQEHADPTFPTVNFPNPEERGALDEAQAFAVERTCDVVLANDPDADRLAVSERCRSTGKWTVFTGDQIGILLGLWLWERIGKKSGKAVAMCASTVSSKMLSTIGEKEGFKFEETLTGFKWIGSKSDDLREEGYNVIFGYEEAIGFCCGSVTSDKDGLSALGVFSEMIISIYKEKRQVKDHLNLIYQKYGERVSQNGYFFCYEPSKIVKILDDLRNGGKYFDFVSGYKVSSIRDLGFPGYDSTTSNKKPTLPISKSSPMLTIRFDNGCVAQFRASGTEPKFKYYIELPGAPGVNRDIVEHQLKVMADVILQELLQPEKNGLISP